MKQLVLRLVQDLRTDFRGTVRELAELVRAVTHDLLWLAARALRLLLTNPRVFATRISMIAHIFMRGPVETVRILTSARRRREEIERSYGRWLVLQGSPHPRSPLTPGPSPTPGRGRLSAGAVSEDLRSPAPGRGAFPETCAGEALPLPHSWERGPGGEGMPLLSIIMPVYNTRESLLEEAIGSVIAQTYGHWELCIADDASTKPSIRPLLDRYARADSRVRVTYRSTSGHISAAANSALALAAGEFIVLLDHDDLLSPDALARVAEVISEDPRVDFIYSDEDKIDEDGNRSQPFFKPAWSPTLLTTCNYITHLAAIRRSLVLEVGGFRDEMVGSQDHDLFLRAAERARAVAHIPRVLYSWRLTRGSTARAPSAKPYAVDATRSALRDAVRRRSLPAEVEETHLNGIYMLRRRSPKRARVSLIVVGEGDVWRDLLRLDEIQVCDLHFLGLTRPVEDRVVVKPEMDALSGEYLLWLDASSRPASPESVTALLEHLGDDHVAVAGGTTRSPRGTVFQAGMAIEEGGQPVYAYAGLSMLPQPNFYLNLKDLPREVASVYAGCCAMRSDTWRSMGGWKEDLPPVLAMCDLCLRALEGGYSTVYMPLARFQREDDLEPVPSVECFPWPWTRFEDPFWSPNMSPASPEGLPFRWSEWRPARVLPCASHVQRDLRVVT